MNRSKHPTPLIWTLSWGCVGASEKEAQGLWRCLSMSRDPEVRAMVHNILRHDSLMRQHKGQQSLADQFCQSIFLPASLVNCIERLWHNNLIKRAFATAMEEKLFAHMGKDGALRCAYLEPGHVPGIHSPTIQIRTPDHIKEFQRV